MVNNFVTVILVLLCIGLGKVTYDKSQQLDKEVQNSLALQDSVSTYKTKTGEIGYEKLVLQATADELRKLNENLYKELEKEKGNVKTITEVKYIIRWDTLYLAPSIDYLDGNEYRLNFEYDFASDFGKQFISGYSKFKIDTLSYKLYDTQLVIDHNELSLNVVTGIKTDDEGRSSIFVRSNFPGLKINSIEGALVDLPSYQESKKWGIGVHTGWGLSEYGYHPYLGIGISYTPIQFNLK